MYVYCHERERERERERDGGEEKEKSRYRAKKRKVVVSGEVAIVREREVCGARVPGRCIKTPELD